MPKKFWQFRNSAESGAELLLYGDISQRSWWGDEATPREFADDLAAIGHVDAITVRINSGGGDVFAATTIGNMLEQNGAEITAKIDGLCASAATIVACHCNKVVAASDATYMIHPVRMGIFDYTDAETLKKCIEAMETIRENIVTLYAKKTGRDKEEVAALMDETSWWTASQAKENGFIDELTDEEDPVVENRDGILFVNSVSMNMPFDKAPKFVQDSLAAAPAAGRFENKAPGAKPGETITTKEVDGMETIKTIDDLRKAYPELCNQLAEAAANEATAAERQRIKDIMETSVDGCEDIANDAMFANPVSADAFARAALKNMKAQGAAYLNGLQKDAKDGGVNDVKSTPVVGGGNEPDEFMNAIREQNKR